MNHDIDIQLAARAIKGMILARPYRTTQTILDDAELSILTGRHPISNMLVLDVLRAVEGLSDGCKLSAINNARKMVEAEKRKTPVIHFIHGIRRAGGAA